MQVWRGGIDVRTCGTLQALNSDASVGSAIDGGQQHWYNGSTELSDAWAPGGRRSRVVEL